MPCVLRQQNNHHRMDLRISRCLLSSSSSSFLSPTRRLLLQLVSTIPRRPPPPPKKTLILAAGRSKKKPGGTSSGRIEGNAEIRRKAKIAARKRTRRLSESLTYRRNNTPTDPFSEEELQMIGLGYDRMVRFMSGPDDPNLRHPHDWFRYGRFGPYSWRGLVVGPPVRGLVIDERVSLISEVRDHEEFERIERHEMSINYGDRVKTFDPNVGIRHYWFFVRHSRRERGDKPWEQWTLAAEVALEAPRSERLDKWALMGRLGNKARAMATQCAAWVRPDIIYVKRPVYQCRFEPQDSFFRLLGPLLDPRTEGEYLFELKDGDGKVVDVCTYFVGLCRIVKISQKAFVDDVTRAYVKLGDEEKSRCLEFLLENHPMELLHPFTKEWKAKLEEMELGCDAPDESEDEGGDDEEVTDWVELEDGDAVGGDDDSDVEDKQEDDYDDPLESKEYEEDEWNVALEDPDAVERMVTRKAEAVSKKYRRRRSKEIVEMGEDASEDEMGMETMDVGKGDGVGGKAAAVSGEDWECVGYRPGPKRRVIKSKIPPELFLRAAVRPYTYRNLVKEIVLLRHAIIDGEVDAQG